MNVKKNIVYLLFLIPMLSIAQTQDSYSAWNSLIVDYKINNSLYLKNEAHFRRTNFLTDWQQILIRPSLHYKVNKTVDLAVGYTYSKNYRDTYNFNENAVWQQLMLSHKSNKASFKHRFRLEHRLINKVETTNSGYENVGIDFKMRFRYRFTWNMPLFKVQEGKNIGLTVFDEIWLNTNKDILPESINQNWFYAGLSYPIFKNASLGVGYLNAYAPKGNNTFASNHILQTTLKYHIK